jgi:hypothetical protein
MLDLNIKDAYTNMLTENTTDEFTEGVYIDLNYSVDYDDSPDEDYSMDHEERYNIEYPETTAIVKLKLTTEGYALNMNSFALAVDKASRMTEEKVIDILSKDSTIQKVWGDDIQKFLVNINEDLIGLIHMHSENDILYLKFEVTVSSN